MHSSPTGSFGRRSRRLVVGLMLAAAGLTPSAARAADDDEPPFDGRVQGYTPDAELKKAGNGGTWMMLFLLSGATISVMFMNAHRSHLD